MQAVSAQFTATTGSPLRKLYWKFLAAFDKVYADSVEFFTIGISSIGGADIIRGNGLVVQEWDRFLYTDYSNRIIDFEYVREQDPVLGGAILSMADITLKNHDDLFTPNNPDSPIADFILPYRPIKLQVGFDNETVQVFVGVIEKMPDVDDRTKTVRVHCIDFLQSLFNFNLDETLILENNRTDEIMEVLLGMAGLDATQYDLDTGLSVIPFFFAPKGNKMGRYLRDLAAAEMGRIYMDEEGLIRFVNRTSWLLKTTEDWTFNRSQIIEKRTTKDEHIINAVDIKSAAREVLPKKRYWQLTTPKVIPAGGSADIWADFENPFTIIDEPAYVDLANTSFYQTNLQSDGSGANYNTYIRLSSLTKFSTSVKMTFVNAHPTTNIYITNIELFMNQAVAVTKSYRRVDDTNSIKKYLERPLPVKNDFIQDESTAESIATIIVEDNKEYNPIRELDVKGVPQLQVGDLVRVTDEIRSDIYYVSRIRSKMLQTAFVQTLTLVDKTIRTYFRIGVSTIGGTDVIGP